MENEFADKFEVMEMWFNITVIIGLLLFVVMMCISVFFYKTADAVVVEDRYYISIEK